MTSKGRTTYYFQGLDLGSKWPISLSKCKFGPLMSSARLTLAKVRLCDARHKLPTNGGESAAF